MWDATVWDGTAEDLSCAGCGSVGMRQPGDVTCVGCEVCDLEIDKGFLRRGFLAATDPPHLGERVSELRRVRGCEVCDLEID